MEKKFSLLFDDAASPEVQPQAATVAVQSTADSDIPRSKPVKFQQLRLQWPIGAARKYGVQIEFSEEGIQNEIKYDTTIKRLEDNVLGDMLFEVYRSEEVWINEKEPDLVMDKLAHETGKIIYPLQLRIDATGSAYGIANYEEIVKRWPAGKADLKNYFEGDFFEKYLAKTEAVLVDYDRFMFAVLYRDWFLQSYFQPIFKDYGQEKQLTDWLKFPLPLSFANPGFLCQQTIGEYTTDQGAVELVHRGELQNDEGLTMQKYTGVYDGIIRLHPFHNHIVAYKGEWQIREYEKNSTVMVKYFELDNSELFARNNWIKDSNTSIVLEEKGKQGSFFNKLFK